MEAKYTVEIQTLDGTEPPTASDLQQAILKVLQGSGCAVAAAVTRD